MRVLPGVSIGLALLAAASSASAERIAVIALPSQNQQPPSVEADRLCSLLISHRHQALCSADVATRLRAGSERPDAAWAASLRQTVGQARGALTRLDRHGASALTRQVEAALRLHGGGIGGPEVLVEWALLERSLASSAGTAPAASRWLRVAAALGPSVTLDPLNHPDDERNAFAQSVTEVSAAPSAALAVVSSPASADLWIDGVRRCATPCEAKVPAGHHFAHVASPGHVPVTFEVDLKPGTRQRREVGLSSAYTGASIDAIAAMLANPSRSHEAGAAIVPIARFLDVARVVVVQQDKPGSLRTLLVSTSGASQRRDGASVEEVAQNLGHGSGPEPVDSGHERTAWHRNPYLWLGVGVVLAGAAATGVWLGTRDDASAPGTGTLVIGGR